MQQRMSPPTQGVETPAFLGSRRVSLSVAALQEAGGQATEEPDLAVERLVERGPEMFMDPAEEESARTVALEESVTDAVARGLSVSKAERLRGILSRRFNVFRRALRGGVVSEIGGNGAGPHGVTSANCSGIVRSVTEIFCPDAVTACRAPSKNGTRICTPGNTRSIISTIDRYVSPYKKNMFCLCERFSTYTAVRMHVRVCTYRHILYRS